MVLPVVAGMTVREIQQEWWGFAGFVLTFLVTGGFVAIVEIARSIGHDSLLAIIGVLGLLDIHLSRVDLDETTMRAIGAVDDVQVHGLSVHLDHTDTVKFEALGEWLTVGTKGMAQDHRWGDQLTLSLAILIEHDDDLFGSSGQVVKEVGGWNDSGVAASNKEEVAKLAE